MTKFSSIIIEGTGEGSELGYPTINLSVPENIPFLLQQGVYAVHAKLGDEKYIGILYYGPNPTMHRTAVTLSVYLLDTVNLLTHPGDSIEIETVKYIREIKEFNLPDELILQMQKDEDEVRFILGSS